MSASSSSRAPRWTRKADLVRAFPPTRSIIGSRDDLDLAKPSLRTELQSCLLHGGLPAGEEVIAPYRLSKKDFIEEFVRPL